MPEAAIIAPIDILYVTGIDIQYERRACFAKRPLFRALSTFSSSRC
jgi:hypothetical protein